jgi:D-alanyl-D-alanine carboxypeptidase/D-alanyl-D-alanine-endopeptidase (penicillin-binding protein 4)
MKILAALLAVACAGAHAALPGGVARAFHEAGVPLSAVSVVVRESGQPQPLFVHDPNRPMNPASVMKIVTTYAALDLLGPDYRWKTEAYLAGKLDRKGTLAGNLVIKGYGDPRITIEQWQAFMGDLRAQGLAAVTGDLVLDRSHFRLPEHDPAAFDQEPLRPYNVGPDALLVNFKSVRFAFAPASASAGNAVAVRADPPLPEISVSGLPKLVNGDCGDWRATLAAQYADLGTKAVATFPGHYSQSCGERDWYVSLLDHPHYVLGMFATYFRERGGRFSGTVTEARPPRNAKPFAIMESAPLYDIVRDVNKLSNNVMARQLFLTLATAKHPPPATPALAADVVHKWLKDKRVAIPGLVLENGSGLSRRERATAAGIAQLLASADASAVREEFASSLAVAAMDGTVQKRFVDGRVAGQALLKTGSLEGVRAIAGYVIDPDGRRFIVAAMVNHPNAWRAGPALDYLVQWVYAEGGSYDPALRR